MRMLLLLMIVVVVLMLILLLLLIHIDNALFYVLLFVHTNVCVPEL